MATVITTHSINIIPQGTISFKNITMTTDTKHIQKYYPIRPKIP
jgi:hypothetical protein